MKLSITGARSELGRFLATMPAHGPDASVHVNVSGQQANALLHDGHAWKGLSAHDAGPPRGAPCAQPTPRVLLQLGRVASEMLQCKKDTVAAALAQDDAIFWHCPRCRAEGRISNWQGTLWDLSERPHAAS
jgi:hypothetical protein